MHVCSGYSGSTMLSSTDYTNCFTRILQLIQRAKYCHSYVYVPLDGNTSDSRTCKVLPALATEGYVGVYFLETG